MRTVCSYCDKDMGTQPPLVDGTVSHGMCAECETYFERQWDGLSLGEYLDRFGEPVLAVGGDGRAVAANRIMSTLLGKSHREVHGLLGGDVMECVYARLPAGCGRTEHCAACTIRNSVEETMRSGVALERVPAVLCHEKGRQNLEISTHRRNGIVFVVINDRLS